MKPITIPTPKHHFGSKWRIVLFLLLAFKCNNFLGRKSLRELLHNTTVDGLRQEIAHKNISKPVKGVDWLHGTVDEGDPDKVKVILDRIDQDKESNVKYNNNFPNSFDPQNGKTVLGKAIEKGHYRIVKLLIGNHYIDPNKVGDDRVNAPTSLMLALQRRNAIIAQLLIKHYGKRLDIITPNWEGATPLHLAIEYGFKDVIESLFEQLPIDYLYKKDKRGRTPLHLAIEFNNVYLAEELVKKVLQSTLPIDNLCAQDENGNTPLHLAIMNKYANLSKLIIEKFSSSPLSRGYLSIQNKNRMTPLDLAYYTNMQEIAYQLRQRGAQ